MNTVLVTGGTGSIGSAFVKRLLTNGDTVRVFSRDETRQYELALEIGDSPNVRYLVGDVRDKDRLKRAMHGCNLVFHAAALKHVPSCEYNPFEAVETNVRGTQNVIEAATDTGVSKVVLLSTDKAVNPCNVMGCTKLLAEKLITSVNQWTPSPICCAVRFGNVLGSRGSVVPTIIRQIQQGGPVTITDERMVRFVMTIEDGVDLCIMTAKEGQAGQVYVSSMQSVWVRDLAEVLIGEYSSTPKAVQVITGGVRAGEKLDEELLNQDELSRTEHKGTHFVVHAKWDKALPPCPTIQPPDYKSLDSTPMQKSEVLALLYRAGFARP